MNTGTYMLRSCVVRMPIDAKFSTFSQRPLTREKVSSIGLRNRPVKCFRQIKSFVNGLVSTRLPEELEFVEEHIEEDYAFGMDFPNDGECLPVVCPREYTSGLLSDRPTNSDMSTSTRSVKAHEFSVESTSNVNFQQRAHQFRDGFNLATQTYSADIEFPVRVGPFQPYRSAKSIGNSIIPYVGEAMIEFDWRQYRSNDSNADVYKVNGSSPYLSEGGNNLHFWLDTPAADVLVPLTQPRHMDVAKYLFEYGGGLAQAARASGSFGTRGVSEPFCLAVAYNGGQEGSFMICPYDTESVGTWYNGSGQTGYHAAYAQPGLHVDNMRNECLKSSLDLKTGFDKDNITTSFPKGTLLNFDSQWLLEHTDLLEDSFPFQCVVGAVSADIPVYTEGADPAQGNALTNNGLYRNATFNGAGVGANIAAAAAATQLRVVPAQLTNVNAGANNFCKRRLRVQAAAVCAPRAVPDQATLGRAQQLANPLGLPSRQVFFEPNDLQFTDRSAAALARNPEVTYAVWEVYDDDFLEHAARSWARGEYSSRDNNAAYLLNKQRAIEELEFQLCKQNFKTGQILGAWIPSAELFDLLEKLDRCDPANPAQVVPQLDMNAEQTKTNRGDQALYSENEDDIQAVHAIRTEYTDILFPSTQRKACWDEDAVTTSHANRQLCLQEIIFQIGKSSKVNLYINQGQAEQPTIAYFLALRQLQDQQGVGTVAHPAAYWHTRFVIPRGTRIRLKTFRHVGIKHDCQLLGARDANAQVYANPQALADGIDFNWGEERGRFPYQLIQPRADNYSGKVRPSGLGGRGFQYEDSIKNVQLSWRSQPELVCEWVILPPSKVQPTYRLSYPQHEFFRALYPSPTFTLPSRGATKEVAIRGLKLNEVPNKVYVYAMLTERSRNYLEWLDVKPTIVQIETTINETVDTTSHIPLWLYRFFKENCPYSAKTKDEWVNDNCWILSPQNLNISAETFTESMARVSTLSVVARVQMNRAYRQISQNYSPALFPGLEATGKSVMTPEFELRVVVTYDNHSLIMNSRNEMLIEKNTLATRGPTGLVRQDRGLPKQGGLMMY